MKQALTFELIKILALRLQKSDNSSSSKGYKELLYRFEFPERSGALLHFLSEMGEDWNISLFHYRNHGAAYGRVLMGFQVNENEREKFQNFISKLGIPYWDESENSAYKKFLS